MKRMILLCMAMLLSAPGWAATIMVFGDSLSAGYGLRPGEGWVDLLRQALPAHQVVNASQSGETTAGGLSRLPAALARHKPDIVVLELGGNDGLRGLPPDDMRANLEQMVAMSAQSKARVLLVGMALPPNYGQAYGRAFQMVYSDLAKQRKLPFVPLLVEGFATDRTRFQADGIHPNASAQEQMRDSVLKVLRGMVKN
ncbi:arylesterase [Rivihabitans pingtungensis]|uniref:arylesterase n=1 Tax=Rivihabitans pingtungensis TaxID=1054498 RepID=UPI00235530CB|nr:arylesterase [Rivihabitans pingtungensis]MCK6437049.1 arylesterase [Rivihabitans pingtungensis]